MLEANEALLECHPVGKASHNLTLRLTTSRRSLILKQSRPWVERRPAISMPWGRDDAEHRFYQAVGLFPEIGAWMPALLHHDAKAHCLVFEALDGWRDCAEIHEGRTLSAHEVDKLIQYLITLHHTTESTPSASRYDNAEMRRFVHDTYFLGALTERAMARLEQGLCGCRAQRAFRRKKAAAVRRAYERATDIFLEPGSCLVHGDFRPDSWLRRGGEIRIIDTEFSFFGRPEIDVGTMLAHLWLGPANRDQAARCLRLLGYAGVRYDMTAVAAVTGAEIIRQWFSLEGAAPARTDKAGCAQLKTAAQLLLTGDLHRLFPAAVTSSR